METKFFIFISLFFSFISCDQTKEQVKQELVESFVDSTKTRYTFSQFNDVDLTVSIGSYQILYDYSTAIDTFFGYSGSFLIGKDSILYLQLRQDKSNEISENVENMYQGTMTNLILFDGKNFNVLKLPYFNTYYSSFTVKNKILYYWGFKNFDQLYACKYDLITKEFQKIKLSDDTGGTDFFGYYDLPYFGNKGIEFSVSEGQRMWVIDTAFKKILTFKEDPSELYFDSEEKGEDFGKP